MSLRDHLPGAGKRKAPDTAPAYRADHCELAACRCGNQGGPDVAIQDKAGNVLGYVCQAGYMARLVGTGKDQWSQWKETSTTLDRRQGATSETQGLHRFGAIVNHDLDRYAEAMAHSQEQGEKDHAGAFD